MVEIKNNEMEKRGMIFKNTQDGNFYGVDEQNGTYKIITGIEREQLYLNYFFLRN